MVKPDGRRRAHPRGAHVSVDLTTELRWFFNGPLPIDVLSWFTKAGTTGLSEDRWDAYRVGDSHDTGVKRRFGSTLELKLRLEPAESFVVGHDLAGQLELWKRWSPADDRVELREPTDWINVDKTVRKRRFDAAGHEVPLSEETRAMNGQGCDAEIVALSVNGRPAWGFAFAAFGPPEEHRPLLEAAWRTLLTGGPPPSLFVLDPAASYGYPEWLARFETSRVTEIGDLVRR